MGDREAPILFMKPSSSTLRLDRIIPLYSCISTFVFFFFFSFRFFSNMSKAPVAEQEPLDLALTLAPLKREQLELLVVKLLYKHPEDLDFVLTVRYMSLSLWVSPHVGVSTVCFYFWWANCGGAPSSSFLLPFLTPSIHTPSIHTPSIHTSNYNRK